MHPLGRFVRTASALLAHSLLCAQAPPAAPRAPSPAARAAAPQDQAPPPEPFGPLATEVIARSYGEAEHWAMRGIVLLSLGTDWHPAGVPIVLQALRDRDERLVPYGVEVLRGMDDESLRQVATTELVGELVERQLKRKNTLLHQRVLEVLTRMLPEARITDRRSAETWWLANREQYATPPWTMPAKADGGQRAGTTSGSVVDRAFDLRDAGLDVAIVIDSTGSMQVAIDTARDAIDDVVALLAGIAPKLRLGLVHYKDLEDFDDGARLLVAMTKNQKEVREKLAKLQAGGGGDFPERVEKGIAVALAKEMGWNKEANRLVLVIGDAPAHDADEAAMLELVRTARDRPLEAAKSSPTGKKAPVRPFVTSTIAINEGPKDQFARIAAAGGGTAVTLTTATPGPPAGGRGAPPPPPPAAAAGGAKKANTSVQQIVEHILLLSFGASHRTQLQRFVRTYFEYRDAGLFD